MAEMLVVAARADELPADRTPVTIYSKGGGRSAKDADTLNRLGKSDALLIEGGTTGWLAQIT